MTSLDEAYANADFIPDAASYPPRWAREAEAFRAALGDRARCDIAYGTGSRHLYDLYLPEGAPQGTLIFVHGGYWRRFDHRSWSHLAAGGLARGRAVAMPSYDLCPAVTIPQITAQVAQAVTHIAAALPGPLTLAGHSAGGHLVARMLAPGQLSEDVLGRVAHVVPISGLSDLAPLQQTTMNDDLRITSEIARSESPLHQPRPTRPVTLWVGADERPAFIDQSTWLAEAWDCDLEIVPGKHHFDVIDALAQPESPLIRLLTS